MTGYLQESIERYQGILDHIQSLEQLLVKGDPGQIQSYVAKLEKLQSEAGFRDRELLESIALDALRWKSHPLFLQRMQLLEQIVEMNNLLLPRVRGMMSVTGAELAQLKEGRAAVSGYHPDAVRSKKLIRGIG